MLRFTALVVLSAAAFTVPATAGGLPVSFPALTFPGDRTDTTIGTSNCEPTKVCTPEVVDE